MSWHGKLAHLALSISTLTILTGCGAPKEATPGPAVEGDTAPVVRASEVPTKEGGMVHGVLFYADRTSRGVWALKVGTPGGVRTYYVASGDQKKPFAQASYSLGQTYLITWVPDPVGQGDGLIIAVRPITDRDKDIEEVQGVVYKYFNEVYFLRTDAAYNLLSFAEQKRTTSQAFRAEWSGDVLAPVADWNGHFEPRRFGIDSHEGDRMVVLADVSRLYRAQNKTEIRRLTLLKEKGAWHIDVIDKAASEDFLQ